MKAILFSVLLSFSALSASAQSPEERFNVEGIDEIFAVPCVATPLVMGEAQLICANVVRAYVGPETHIFHIEGVGEVVIIYHGTKNYGESEEEDSDTVEVISIPDGFYATPNMMVMVEESNSVIRIIEYVAG
jgi:hypothetical protein